MDITMVTEGVRLSYGSVKVPSERHENLPSLSLKSHEKS